ncbi:hypothetical protein ELH75_31805 (plasmid) [Rhizobium leguminosarum]|uniref:hypothetical protein n=1 Tax=Rhizobium leguminosarum TaxID=384 RepID=UPI00103190AA|nr:hypothetical protein [Rhizobium leguminosarum]TAZ47084.1 hypothetical protein ELH75_31805 [Rhizobium leguminosarum]
MIRLNFFLFVALLLSASADAHSRRAPSDTSGISVPALTHGQMAVIGNYRAEIDELAAWVAPRDYQVRKLLTFARQQYARCFWGLMPRSIEDEASPFNECSHAYLAADRAMLMRIVELPYWPQMATDLRDRVEESMIRQNASLVLCMFSATSFNTASLINPDFHDFLLHIPTLLTILAAFALSATLLAAGLFAIVGLPVANSRTTARAGDNPPDLEPDATKRSR